MYTIKQEVYYLYLLVHIQVKFMTSYVFFNVLCMNFLKISLHPNFCTRVNIQMNYLCVKCFFLKKSQVAKVFFNNFLPCCHYVVPHQYRNISVYLLLLPQPNMYVHCNEPYMLLCGQLELPLPKDNELPIFIGFISVPVSILFQLNKQLGAIKLFSHGKLLSENDLVFAMGQYGMKEDAIYPFDFCRSSDFCTLLLWVY